MPMQRQQQQHSTRNSPVASANDRVGYLLDDYDRVTSSLDAANRQLHIHRFCRFAAIAIVILDGYFSYNVLAGSGREPWLSAGLSLFICSVQLQVNMALFNRRLYKLIALDRNGDGKIDPSEWARWGATIIAIGSGYALNIGTNMIGVDGYGLGSLAFLIPGVPERAWIAALTTFFFSTLLCFGDELIQVLADDNTAALKRRIPDLQNQQAVLDARLKEARAFRTQLMTQAESEGMKRGTDYRI